MSTCLNLMDIKYKSYASRLGERHMATLYVDNIEMGEFSIYTHDNISSMNIYVDDSIRGRGCSKRMIALLLGLLKWSDNTNLYIDTDASNGFWTACGLIDNTNDNGYEKVIKFGDLLSWANR